MEFLKESSPYGEDLQSINENESPPLWRDSRELLRNKEMEINLDERKKYTRLLFLMLCFWLATMLAILFVNAIGRIPGTAINFTMSDAVIITLISTTTANIAAFFLVVTKYLFPLTAH